MTIPDSAILLDRFLKWEAERRDDVYLTQPYPDGSVVDYTWAMVGDQARRAAAYLASLDLPGGSRIALLGKNSAHWIMADLAIMLAGMVSVPLYPTFSAESVRYALAHSDAKLLILGKLDDVSDNWPNIRAQLPPGLPMLGLPLAPRGAFPQWQEITAEHAPLVDARRPSCDELCTIVYTSGSTGVPKGVMHSHGSMAVLFLTIQQIDGFNLTSDERGFSYLPLAHMAERAVVEAASLGFGFRVFFANSLATFTDDVKRARPTIFLSVPRLWNKFHLRVCEKIPAPLQPRLFALPWVGTRIKHRILCELGLDQARIVVTGTAPMPPHLMQWYRSIGLELLDGYGMSECGLLYVNRPGHVRAGTVGQPQPGVAARIAENGELEIRSAGQMLGYYRLPELTAAQTTPDGFLRTGDLGRIDADGFLTITGRVKDIFKTAKGKYVAPQPIEQKLLGLAGVEAACVAGAGCAMPFALLQLSAETCEAIAAGTLDRTVLAEEIDALRKRINTAVESHERLQYVVVVSEAWTVENAMLTPTLKLRRSAIEAHYMPHADAWEKLGQAVVWER
ncbi:AMP-binding acetyl-CoA synthetase [Burkholderia sp. Bp8963]|uniref:AMP-binding protein n=1 Tax=Burkholderia sp. Bp8963 TaxID=2184547 RepID=UPI000F5A8452|nr:AMP-binding protein [Burkholderia sp. Bp8963]RQS63639.1 AMP-binding acetyl-CoA synthetase [Burkholderia sp. Bp8963]